MRPAVLPLTSARRESLMADGFQLRGRSLKFAVLLMAYGWWLTSGETPDAEVARTA